MILEGIITTLSSDGELNIAPMGPHFQPSSDSFELRPFETSTTYQNLAARPFGVLHVTDDVLLFAKSAINQLEDLPPTVKAEKIEGRIIESACQFFEFSANEIPTVEPRKTFHCSIVRSRTNRNFFGFNRAKHAVLEATILATRIDFIPIEEILAQYSALKTIVQKTGGAAEHAAFDLLECHVNPENH